MTLKRLDVYVAVSDMESAIEFYRGVFESEPALRTPNYTGFVLGGAMFGLFRQDAFPPAYPCVRGNSTTTNIFVDDIDAEFERIIELKPSGIIDEVKTVGGVRLFHFSDHDMNVIEVYSTP